MRVIGVDPGSRATGYGIVEEINNKLIPINWGVIKIKGKEPLTHRLKRINDGIHEVIDAYKPDVMAVENIFFAVNPKSSLILGQARGVTLLAAANSLLPVFEYSPLEVKLSVTGYGRAEKSQINKMVRNILSIDKNIKHDDESDALAVAICHHHSS